MEHGLFRRMVSLLFVLHRIGMLATCDIQVNAFTLKWQTMILLLSLFFLFHILMDRIIFKWKFTVILHPAHNIHIHYPYNIGIWAGTTVLIRMIAIIILKNVLRPKISSIHSNMNETASFAICINLHSLWFW